MEDKIFDELEKILKGNFGNILENTFDNTLKGISSNNWKIYKDLEGFEKYFKNIISEKSNLTDVNIKLKEFLKNNLSKNHKWIIHEWGGIKSFKNFDSIEKQLEKIKEKKDIDFKNISSISKILSFYNPNKYFIYDSRVVYVLNWLILKSNIDNKVFFKMPSGRNKKITFIDISTLINIKDNKSVYHDKDFYYIYSDLIIKLHKKVFNDNDIFKTEMLLFSIADNYIFEDIKSNLSLDINKN